MPSLLRDGLTFFLESLPIAFVDFVKLLLPAVTTMRVGHSATAEDAASYLAAASIGILAFNVAGQMIASAPLAAMDTIAPQAHGAGNAPGVGLAGLRAIITAIVFLLPTIPLWICAEGILSALGQPIEVARLGAVYMRLLLPGLPPLLLFELCRKILYAQSIRGPPAYAAAAGLLTHWLWLEVWCRALGELHGAPLALCCTYATMAIVQVAHIRWLASQQPALARTWPRSDQRALLMRDRAAWTLFLTTSGAALLSLSEWLFWELCAFHVGTVSPSGMHRNAALAKGLSSYGALHHS